MITNRLWPLAATIAVGCGLEARPFEPSPPGLDGIWAATSWTVTDKLAQPRFVDDGMGGMVEVPGQLELIGLGGTVVLTINRDGTYSVVKTFPGFPLHAGVEIGNFVLAGNVITFMSAAGPGGGTDVAAQTGDDLTLDEANTTWDFDQDGTITVGDEDASIAKVFRRT